MADFVPVDHQPEFDAEQFVPPFLADWAKQAAGKDVQTIKNIAEPLIKTMAAPGEALASTTPITTEEMIKPAMDLAGLVTLGAGAMPAEANALRAGIKAYHGSPHDFDAFDLSKIGTGEGAQAYGHGLYFAQNEKVAKGYRDALSPKWDSYVEGSKAKDLGQKTWEVADRMASLGMTPEQFLQHRIDQVAGAKAANNPMRADIAQDILNEERPIIESLLGKKVDKGPGGRMYEVNINADPEHFLDWDKPLSEQNAALQKLTPENMGLKFKRLDNGYMAFVNEQDRPIGQFQKGGTEESFRKNWTDRLQSLRDTQALHGFLGLTPQESINALNKAGIPGIKYLDQGSRSAGEGSRNYVVFDDKLIDILKKYGIAGLPAAGAAAGAMQSQPSNADMVNAIRGQQ
jgi:hypothetical protein